MKTIKELKTELAAAEAKLDFTTKLHTAHLLRLEAIKSEMAAVGPEQRLAQALQNFAADLESGRAHVRTREFHFDRHDERTVLTAVTDTGASLKIDLPIGEF